MISAIIEGYFNINYRVASQYPGRHSLFNASLDGWDILFGYGGTPNTVGKV